MVEYVMDLDSVFISLSDPTRRDILQRVAQAELTVGQIARDYDLTFAAVSKHLKFLESAKLITKRKRGKERLVSLHPYALKDAADYLESYRRLWEERFDSLDAYLNETKEV